MSNQSPRPRILLVGYNGANNTGAEAKLLASVDEIRSVVGEEAHLTIPSLNVHNLRRYIKEAPNLSIEPVRPALFFWDIRRFVRENDLIMLVEGSCYMDTWSSALLWYYLLATRYARSMKKPCVAYAVDAGSASRFNRWLIRREASKTDLIIVRTASAADRLKEWQVEAPIEVSADNAFGFRPNPSDQGLLRRIWPEAAHVVGVAAQDMYKWPVRIRPWGPKKYRYRWPYHHTHTRESLRKSEELARFLAHQADLIIEKHDRYVALIGMEELDSAITERVHDLMKYRERAKMFTSMKYNASQMTSILLGLELLITSRFHAGVLSLSNQIPQTAIGHDLRIRDFYTDLGIPELFVDHESPDRFKVMAGNIERLLAHHDETKGKLREGYERYKRQEKRNPELLRAFLEVKHPEWLM